jgi:hypothetical protein
MTLLPRSLPVRLQNRIDQRRRRGQPDRMAAGDAEVVILLLVPGVWDRVYSVAAEATRREPSRHRLKYELGASEVSKLQRRSSNLLFQPSTPISRGVLVVDCRPELIPLLETKNFIVLAITRGMADEIGQLLALAS